jgi:transcriptional regulator with XRE-family HTH domain
LKSLGELLKEGRQTKRLLLREVAAAINADTAMISKFENGKRTPTRKQISLLSGVLDLNEKEVLVTYLSDKVVLELAKENCAKDVLRMVEKKLDRIKIETK